MQDTYCATYANKATLDTDINTTAGYSRFHVASHSLALGHVYPAADATPNLGNWAAFYEHSTDPSAILDTDIVDYVYTSNVALSMGAVIDGAWSTYSTKAAWYKTSVTERYLLITSPAAIGTILLTSQNNPIENGVWQIGTMSAKSNAYSWIQTTDPSGGDIDYIPVPGWVTHPAGGCLPDDDWGGYPTPGAGYVVSGVHPEIEHYAGYGFIVTPTNY